MVRRFLCAAVAVSVANLASAAIIPVNEFLGAKSEGFETQDRFQFRTQYPVFGNDGDLVKQLGGGQGLHITTGWSFFSTVFPRSGEVFMGGAGVNATWEFVTP